MDFAAINGINHVVIESEEREGSEIQEADALERPVEKRDAREQEERVDLNLF